MFPTRLLRFSARRLTPVSEQDIAHFASFLAPNSIISSLSAKPNPTDDLAPFNNDWMGRFRGRSTTVLKPKSTIDVSKILQWCNQRGIAVVPQGGNTGLVGGSVPINDELILSLSNLNKVRSFDPASGKLFFPNILSLDPHRCMSRYPCGGCWLHSPIPH